VESNESILWQ